MNIKQTHNRSWSIMMQYVEFGADKVVMTLDCSAK